MATNVEELYKKWHECPYHPLAHWSIFLSVSLIFSFSILSVIKETYTPLYAQTANTLYVDINHPNCDDSRLKANVTESLPWCSIGRAAWGSTDRAVPNSAQAVAAGETVYIAAGTYHGTGTGIRFTPLYNPANSGTSGSPIVFQADPGGVVLTQTGFGPLIGSNSRSYIEWRGPFIINTANAYTKSDTGAVVFYNFSGGAVLDGAIINGDWHTPADNATSFSIESSTVGNPGTITTTAPHGLSTGQYIFISGHSGSTPNLNGGSQEALGIYRVTVTGDTTFTIQYSAGPTNVNITSGGNGGTGIRVRDDNTSGIRCEDADGIIIRNTTIRRFQSFVNIRNSAGIQTYRCGSMLIENNLIEENGTGIQLKGGFADEAAHSARWGTGWTIRKNIIRNSGRNSNGEYQGIGIDFGNNAAGTAQAPIIVTQNLIINAYSYGLEWFLLSETNRWNEPHYVYAVNNTIIGGNIGPRSAVRMAGSLMPNSSNRFWNNIISGTWNESINWGNGALGSALESRFDPEHNIYHNNQAKFGSAEGTDYQTLLAWTTAYPDFDSASPASITSDPLFVDAGNGNYRLQAGSPALTLGRTITAIHGTNGQTIPAGAYITGDEVIGIDSGGAPPPTPPTAPSSLSATAVSTTQINLSWTDNSNDETGFRIERKTGSGGTYSQVAELGANTTTYQNTSLSPSTQYYYRVRAYNSDGNSSYSNEANATTESTPPPSGGGGGGGGGTTTITTIMNPALTTLTTPTTPAEVEELKKQLMLQIISLLQQLIIALSQNPQQLAPAPITTPTTPISLPARGLTGPFGFGISGTQVRLLQEILIKEGVFSGTIDGYYGSTTMEAVRRFQAKHGIEQTGVAGPATRAKLNELYF